MGKGRDREPRRRDFDDDYRPPSDSRSRPPQTRVDNYAGPPRDAVVKWFNPEKGFGFVELADGSADAFLHVNTIQAAGVDTVSPGTQLRVHVGQGAKGPQVSAVVEVGDVVEQAPVRGNPRHTGDRPPRSQGRAPTNTSGATTVSGEVKWFNPTKGFGFIQAADGLKDIFIHSSVVSQAGVTTLHEGQQIQVKAVTTPKGREAISIESLD